MYLKLDESKWYRHTQEWSDRSKGLGRVDVYKGQIEVVEDVVPIIRCKDCKYGEVDDKDFPHQYLCHYTGDTWNDENFFCAGAERK